MNVCGVDAAKGAMIGAVIGDALGSNVEFKKKKYISKLPYDEVFEMYVGGTWNTLAGQVTDDMEMGITLARSIIENDFVYDSNRVFSAYTDWYNSNPFDCGGNTQQAITYEYPSKYSESNGSMMKLVGLAIYLHDVDITQSDSIVQYETELTHMSNVVYQANLCYTDVIRMIIAGEEITSLHEDAYEGWMNDVIKAVNKKKNYSKDFFVEMGHVRKSIHNALYQMMYATSFEDGIIDTISRGGDTDTNACIAGAFLGAKFGIDQMPEKWVDAVLNCTPYYGFNPRPCEYWANDCVELAEMLYYKGDI